MAPPLVWLILRSKPDVCTLARVDTSLSAQITPHSEYSANSLGLFATWESFLVIGQRQIFIKKKFEKYVPLVSSCPTKLHKSAWWSRASNGSRRLQLRHGRSAACPANKLPVIKHLIFGSRCTLNVRHVFQIKCLGHAPGFKCCLNLGSVSLSDAFMMIMWRHKQKDQLIKVLLMNEWSKA